MDANDSDAPADDGAARELVEQLVAMIRDGRKIEAIKVYREATGRGLKESKDAVEAIERRDLPSAGQTAEQPGISDELARQLESMLREGRKIPAIKCYRNATGQGLKESKEAVERFAALRGLPCAKSGCAGSALLMIVSLAMAAVGCAVWAMQR